MELKLERRYKTDKSITGNLLIDNKFECYTLEKISDKAPIPAGKYKIDITYSNRFKKDLPLIYNTPDFAVVGDGKRFEGIRFHIANRPEDLEGCIGVGLSCEKDWIGESANAMEKLYAKLLNAKVNKNSIELEIKGL